MKLQNSKGKEKISRVSRQVSTLNKEKANEKGIGKGEEELENRSKEHHTKRTEGCLRGSVS